MKTLSPLFTTVARAVAVLALAALPFLWAAEPALALTQDEQRDAICTGLGGTTAGTGGNTCATGATDDASVTDVIRNVGNIIIFITGAISVLMLVIAGTRYVLSGGDQAKTKSAKDTILYALVGLAVAFTAYAIVNFVLGNISEIS